MNLSLTTPYTRNNDVKRLQAALHKHGWLQGSIDGVYGPDTGRAVYRGKYWLGYRVPDERAANLFYDYATGAKHPTEAMLARISRRTKLKETQPNRLKMFHEAGKWLGTKENPRGSNRVMFSKWYGLTGPWCAMFVTYCGVQVAALPFTRAKMYAYVPYMVNDARAGHHNLAVTYKPQQGDLVCFDWEHNGIADHVGFFDRWTDISGKHFKTIEGNTGIGNDSNGGQVMRRDRSKSDVQAFIHVGG